MAAPSRNPLAKDLHAPIAPGPGDGALPTRIMGVLNVTPDSFSDGGRFFAPDAALAQARRMLDEGAAIIDVGGESTRPGSQPMSAAQEMDRVIPVVERLRAEADVLISIDTSKPEMMREAVRAGAGMINDVRALRAPGALETAASLGVPVCLMHMQGEPRTMQIAPHYEDVVREVKAFLEERALACEARGMARGAISIDPGFGFGKTLEHNLTLLARLEALVETRRPVVVGLSRKSMIGKLLNRAVEDRVHASVGLAVLAALKGAAVVRVHDVRPTADALAVVRAVAEAMPSGERLWT